MKLKNPFSYLIIFLLIIYKKVLSPVLPRACRYTPTCSEYMIEAIKKYGPLKGLKLGLNRLSTCHPWGGSGYDPLK